MVLENAIEEQLVDRLYDRIVQDNTLYLKKPQMRWNQGPETENISQIPPLTPEWLYRDFYANPHIIRVVENILGPKPELRFSKGLSSLNYLSAFTRRLSIHTSTPGRPQRTSSPLSASKIYRDKDMLTPQFPS